MAPIRLKRRFIMGTLLVVLISLFIAVDTSQAGDVTVIRNINQWRHPVKDVLQRNRVVIYKVELHDKTYPIFYVRFPYDPRLGHNDNYFKPLYYDTLKANGFWNYAFVDRSFQCRINITWDKKTRTLSESLDDIN